MSVTTPPLRPAIAAIAAIFAALALIVILARSWKASSHADADMRLAFRAQAPIVEQAQRREQQRDLVLGKDLAKIAREKRASKTPAEIAKRLPVALPALPQPVTVSLGPDATLAREFPTDPPAVITVPRADLQPLFDALEECRACQERLAAAQQDLIDERAKASALAAERDAAVSAARGGGFWARFHAGVKWFVIGGAIGAIAASATRR